MYTFEDRVRYSQTNELGVLSLEGILDYFQDCSCFQSEDLGVGIEYLAGVHMLWVLSSWQIVVERYPKRCEKIKVGTFPYEFKACFGNRNFVMEDEEGNRIAYANALFTLVEEETFRPGKITELMLKQYHLEEKLDMNYAPRKIAIPERGERQESFFVKKHHLDVNNHVNNGQYIRMAFDVLPKEMLMDESSLRQLRAEYKKAALLGDEIVPYVYCKDGVRIISLCAADDSVYAVIELRQAGEPQY